MSWDFNHISVRVVNNSGLEIAKNKVVAVVGFDATTTYLPRIVLGDADAGSTHSDFYITVDAIADGDTGYVVKGKQIASSADLDTSAVTTVGDPVYLDTASPGAFTATAPTAVNSKVVPLGWVTVKSATVGQIKWHIGPVQKIGSSELQTGAGTGGAMVSAGGTDLTVTAALHAGRTIKMDQAGGTTFTLPAPTGSGNIYRFLVTVASNANIINADATGTSMAGGILVNDSGDSNAAAADFQATAATSNRITMTTLGGGGSVGDFVEVQDMITGPSGFWAVSGVFAHAGDPTNPFSHF